MSLEVPAEATHCIAAYDFEARSENELTLKKGDEIKIVSRDEADWWTGESSRGVGVFPKAYVTKRLVGRAMYDYAADKPHELSLAAGALYIITVQNDFGWWEGRHRTDSDVDSVYNMRFTCCCVFRRGSDLCSLS